MPKITKWLPLLLLLHITANASTEETAISCILTQSQENHPIKSAPITEEIIINISNNNERLWIYGDSPSLQIDVSNENKKNSRSVKNNSDQNQWIVERVDDRGQAIVTKKIFINRTNGSFIYHEFLERTGYPSWTKITKGTCKPIDKKSRIF